MNELIIFCSGLIVGYVIGMLMCGLPLRRRK